MDTEKSWVQISTQVGKNAGEVVGSYGSSRRSSSIVFFPRDNQPEAGKIVRVILVPLKEDSRGNMMYRGNPAPSIPGEQWVDNADGTASCWETSIDWLGNAVPYQKISDQQLQSRKLLVRTTACYEFLWGKDLTDSQIVEKKINHFSLQTESCYNNENGSGIDWQETGEEEEALTDEILTISSIEIRKDCGLPASSARWSLVYDDECSIYLNCSFSNDNKNSGWHKWDTLPNWLKDQFQNDYPVCACGRERTEKWNDGYSKCRICRSEETCDRCNQKKTIAIISGRMICNDCEFYEKTELQVRAKLDQKKLQLIAGQADLLLQGTCFSKEEGLLLLKAIDPNHYWSEHPYYHFDDNGVFGSHLPATALEILRLLPQSQGNSLVDLVGWIVDEDFFQATQIDGKTKTPYVSESSLNEMVKKLVNGNNVVACFLRGPETDRRKLADWLKDHQDYKYNSDDQKAQLFSAVSESCNGLDYRQAVETISRFELELAERKMLANSELKSEVNSVLAMKEGGIYGPFEPTGKFTKKGYPIWSYFDRTGTIFSVDSWSKAKPAKYTKYLGWVVSEITNHEGDIVKFVRLEFELTIELQEMISSKSPQAEKGQTNQEQDQSETSDYDLVNDLDKLKRAWGK